ncbi:DNA-directed RNA polymerase subunit beta' [Patescibacteria group bacterium]|nr:DNA-directed RNA polymerase subunit beta' [Patescibacteria group bacterium]
MKTATTFSSLKICLASPDEIRSWSHGEVTKPETINYRTQKPEKDGLFCERIFGPTKDWECYCGKYKRVRFRGIVCDKCGVEVTQSRVRRERMGHIELASPVCHVWFFKGAPSKISLLLDIPPKSLTSIIYFSKYLILSVDQDKQEQALKTIEIELKNKTDEIRQKFNKQIEKLKKQAQKDLSKLKKDIKVKDELVLKIDVLKTETKRLIASQREQMVAEITMVEEIYNLLTALIKQIKSNGLLSDSEYEKLLDYNVGDWLTVGMGAEVILEAIKKVNLESLVATLKEELNSSSEAKRLRAIKRLQVAQGLLGAEINPEWMILRVLPVMPPDLRPMVQLSGGRFATSDSNDLYRRVINRNNRLKHLLDLGAPNIIVRNEKRMLQESVDSLIDASQAKTSRRTRAGRTLKSLSDTLKGKQGRFRQNLLGKRVDYSGRSVIVVGPELKLNQCGIPKDMALEMFKPFVLHEVIKQDLAPNIRAAKDIIDKRQSEVFDILEKVTKKHPVLLNRAPTLHKLSIQAFWPVLVEGSAIRLHPVVCAGFNADFDGDQMAVHVPLTKKARKEAIKYMLPEKNLLKPSDGHPESIPDKKEMAVGIYYLTSVNPQFTNQPTVFSSSKEAKQAYQTSQIKLRQLIKVRLSSTSTKITETTVGRIIFNEILPSDWDFINHGLTRNKISTLFKKAIDQSANKEVVKLIDSVKDLGFETGMISGLSFAITDNELYKDKDKVISQANQKAKEIENNFKLGLITNDERKKLVIQMWMNTTEDLTEKTWQSFSKDNPVRLIIDTGMGRITKNTIKQLSAMRGINVDPLGNFVELPTKGNFRQGLSIFEYVNAIRGSRKGLTDTALRTADAGYLTRRLVDVSHDAIIRSKDCGTKDFMEINLAELGPDKFLDQIIGRNTAKKVLHPKTKKVLVKKGNTIDEDIATDIITAKVKTVSVRTPLGCKLKSGLCIACYGFNYATNKQAVFGDPVGIIAAQSIGEPGTQLTMRTKHSGGIAGLDVTQGLPRVTELFEVRTPKVLSPVAEISGKVSITETDTGHKLTITPTNSKEESREYLVPLVQTLSVSSGDLVGIGTQLASGGIDIKKYLNIKGLRAAQNYLIKEIRSIYASQGINIHNKHFEVIVKQMCDRVVVDTVGDTSLIPGEIISKGGFEKASEATIVQGGEPASATTLILGTIRASLYTDSWLSAASFQDTTQVLTSASLQGKVDNLIGLKENVIIGRLIPSNKARASFDTV